MRTWVLGWACAVAVSGCGGRSQPPLGEQESEVGGASTGSGGVTITSSSWTRGGTSVGAGASTAMGGSAGTSTTIPTTSPKEVTVDLPGPAHWFAAAPVNGNLSLVGIDANYEVRVAALPLLAGMSFPSSGTVKFSKTGNHFCYGSQHPSTEIGVADLAMNTATARVVPIPAKGSLRYFDCVGWLTESLILLNGYASNQPGTPSEYVVVSTDPTDAIPDLTPVPPDQIYAMSPNRKLWFETTSVERILYRVTDDGFRGEDVLFDATPLPELVWSLNSRRLFTAHRTGDDTLPRLAVYDIPTSGSAIPLPLPPHMAEGHPHEGLLSTDGRYLSKRRESASSSGSSIVDVCDLDVGKSAVITNPNYWDLTWLGDMLLAQESESGRLISARITPALVATGSITLTPTSDQNGPISGLFSRARLSGSSLLVQRSMASQNVLQVLTATATGLVAQDILPGVAGDSKVGTLLWSAGHDPNPRHLQVTAAAFPSYHLLDFYEGSLFRSIRLKDYFSDADKTVVLSVPELLGVIARYKTRKEYAWLYVVGPSAGRLITLPLPPADDNDRWFFPETWPTR